MDIRIQDVQSRVQATDSQKLLDPRVMKQIVRACVEAVREDQAREKRRAQDRELTNGVAPDRQ
jgi:DNA recombination-dependent growth factor C